MKAGIEQKFIKIGEQDYPIKKSARAYLKFEEISGHSIDSYDGSTKDAFSFLYSCLWGGGSRISYEDFLDLIDNEDVNKLIISFVKKMSEPASEKKQTVR
jgi:hypothetical protein